MNESRVEFIQSGYDHVRQAYIIEKYVNGIYKCSYTAWINHQTRTFKCYPRSLALGAPSANIMYLHETQVKRQLCC